MSRGPEGGRFAPVIDVQFDRPGRHYDPGGPFNAAYRVGGVEPEVVRTVEASVAWYTEGKGEEDLGVHVFERIVDPDAVRAALDRGILETRLPPSPLSYEGVIVKIRWCVRVRVFHAGGRDFVSEHVFEVGAVPPANPPEPVATEATP
ncbi:MAG: hypothetical protein ACKOSQ_06415 [Planctomycetaceae bacterium]